MCVVANTSTTTISYYNKYYYILPWMPIKEVLIINKRVGVSNRQDLVMGGGLGQLAQARLGHLGEGRQ